MKPVPVFVIFQSAALLTIGAALEHVLFGGSGETVLVVFLATFAVAAAAAIAPR